MTLYKKVFSTIIICTSCCFINPGLLHSQNASPLVTLEEREQHSNDNRDKLYKGLKQSSITNKNLNKSISAKYDIHLAWGYLSGGRIGFRYYLFPKYSLETSFGIDSRAFLTGYYSTYNFTLGFNIHKIFYEKIHFHPNIIIWFDQTNMFKVKDLLLGFDFGELEYAVKGIDLFFRVGIYSVFHLKNDEVTFGILPNLDFGISFGI